MTPQPQLQLFNASGDDPRLVASRDRHTGTVHFPVFRDASPLSSEHETVELSATGALYSYTIIHPSPKSGAAPFAIGYVDFPEGVRVFGRIATSAGERPRIGATLRAIPDAANGYSFEPVPSRRPQ